jgi:serine/threonine-protein kinase
MIVSNPNPQRCETFQLQRLQCDELTDEQAGLLSEHLEHCEHCRKALDRTIALDAEWTFAKSTIRDRFSETHSSSSHDLGWSHGAWSSWLKPYHETETGRQYIGILDTYPIVRVVGAGGMGIVFEGWDRELHRPVAIKAMHLHLAAIGIARQRFVREARCAASIVHTNVVAIHRINAEHTPPYFVMPLIAGESLQERLDRVGSIPVDQALRITAQVASGLSAAEKQGLIHRDVKPANILVEHGTDRALLTDFGLVRALDEATITHSSALAGTPQYMSPEQASGNSLDPRTDLYSLGAVLYAMLTGRPPFTESNPLALVKKIAESMPQPVTHFEPSIPRPVGLLVEWLMEKDVKKRAPNAAEVASVAMEIHANLLDPTKFALPARIRSLAWHGDAKRLLHWLPIAAAVVVITLLSTIVPAYWNSKPSPTDRQPVTASDLMPILINPDAELVDLARQLDAMERDAARLWPPP